MSSQIVHQQSNDSSAHPEQFNQGNEDKNGHTSIRTLQFVLIGPFVSIFDSD